MGEIINKEHEEQKEEEKEAEPPHPKTPLRYVQKFHPKYQTLGDKDSRVHTRRKLICTLRHANFALLSKIEPKNFVEASKGKHWINSIDEELDQI